MAPDEYPAGTGEASSSAFLLQEFEHLSDSFLRNEELGDRRVNLFLTLATGVLAVLAAANTDDASAWTIGLIGIAVFGIVTFRRITYRNIKSDEYKLAIGLVRRYFVERDPDLARFVLFSEPQRRRRRRAWGRGGLSETVALANCAAAAAALAVAVSAFSLAIAVVAGLAAGGLVGVGHWLYAERAYAAADVDADPLS